MLGFLQALVEVFVRIGGGHSLSQVELVRLSRKYGAARRSCKAALIRLAVTKLQR